MIKNTKIDSNLNILVDEENILFFSVRNAFKGNKSIKIYFNTLLFNIFESNIVLKVFIKNKKNKKIELLNYIEEFSDLNIGKNIPEEKEEKVEKEDENYFLINIEIDGIEKTPEKKERFYHLRDEYLKSQGVYIVRVNNSDLKKSHEIELSRWLVTMVTHYTEKHITR